MQVIKVAVCENSDENVLEKVLEIRLYHAGLDSI